MNGLEVTLFLNKAELIYLHKVKGFQVLLFNNNSFICTKFNGFKYCYQTIIV